MASKTDFSAAEWQVLQWAVADTITYLSMADPGLWDTFKEASGAAHYVAGMSTTSDNLLVRELAAEARTRRDKAVTGDPGNVAGEAIERVKLAVGIVAQKAPDDLAAFKELVVGAAKATAEAAHGIAPAEAAAIERLEAELAA